MHRYVLSSLFFLALLTLAPASHAQQAAPWQQEVAYEMDVTLLADRHRIVGTQRLTYVNNSPDTLNQVFYHLYFNAFHPHSMMADRNRHLPDPDPRVVPRIFELGPEEIGYQQINRLKQDGLPVHYRIHDTVMQVDLARPILPGESTVFDMAFEGQVPLQTRRSGRDSREGIRFSMAQWYPKMAAYDAIGWHAHPYIGREFYAPFGTFDVRLTLPANYVVGATGTLQNPAEVGHGYEVPPGSGPQRTGPAARADGTTPDSLVWHFVAERVHDFAWAADPDYIHERHLVTDVPGRDAPVEIHLLYQPDVADGWSQMGEWMKQLTRFFSERYGTYEYPQFTVAQGGDGGMEYPMFTLIAGDRPPASLFSVTAHEFAHMWFYGMVASNESLFSWIDEGFTNYVTHEARHHIFHGRPGPADHSAAIQAVVDTQLAGIYERPNKAADWYDTNTGFGVASYHAGQAFIALLGYVIGDEVRDRFLHRFATEWRWRHPYPADIQQTAQKVSGMQLHWLFEQFLTGAELYDYAVADLAATRAGAGYVNTITLERRQPGVLPVDLLLTLADGSRQWVHIPVDVAFGHRPMPSDWIVTRPWPWVREMQQVSIETASPVVQVELDPAGRTPDIDRKNHRISRPAPSAVLPETGP